MACESSVSLTVLAAAAKDVRSVVEGGGGVGWKGTSVNMG